MRKCLLFLYLAGLWAGAQTSECVRELREDVDFPGSDVLQILTPDARHCQLACTQHHMCLFFTFIRSDWNRDNRQFYCYLKHTDSGAPLIVSGLKGVTSGFSLRHCPDKQGEVCLSTVYNEVDFFGEDYLTMFMDSYVECQKACTVDPACQFFTYTTDNFSPAKYRNKCHLKYSRTLPTPPVVKVGKDMVSGFSRKLCSLFSLDRECRSKILKDIDFPGNDIEQVPAPSPEHCQILCRAHPRCTFFSYTTASYETTSEKYKLLCFLKHNVEERPSAHKDNVMSGMPARFCQPSNACATLTYKNIEFMGADKKVVKLDSPATCEEACTADPDCQFYTFVYNTITASPKCYLKQLITVPLPPQIALKKDVVSGFHLRNCKLTDRAIVKSPSEDLAGSVEGPRCGLVRNTKEKVLGGRDAAPGAWPWQVSLQLKHRSGNSHICGGSSLSPRWIITAAHCLESTNASDYRISAGVVKLSEAAQSHAVESMMKHPDFNEDTFENDVALVRLKTPLKYTALQGSICLPDKEKEAEIWGQSCTVTGWGKLASGALPDILQQAQVPLITPEECDSLLLQNKVYSNMLCAGYQEGGVDTCQGDSGGPLVCQAKGRWYLMGVTSWGDGCGEAKKPGVYTRVASYFDWIQNGISC
ncbi:coagulation factor XI-like isoform X2 [Brienomyrus brachyistius]|uniref:coagulation factor XI-like isoform X2 n=1 Tax=Brienomyrus brachyistius TaxID=42636 RepID=UPI0020B439D0|nr:coagulation factor XI-like isoform X2 [Brienomyrus brachyistius]